MKSAPEEKMAAQSFISSLPHFVRIMKKFNISGSYTLVSISIFAHSYDFDWNALFRWYPCVKTPAWDATDYYIFFSQYDSLFENYMTHFGI